MQNKLTAKQEAFVRYIIEGKSKTQAYKLAYDTSNFKESTINVKASKLFKSKSVQDRYNEMLEELKKEVIYDRSVALKDLTTIKDIALAEIVKDKKVGYNNGFMALKAIELLNNLLLISSTDEAKLKLEYEKLEFAKSKIVKDNEVLQKENAKLLRELVADVKESE